MKRLQGWLGVCLLALLALAGCIPADQVRTAATGHVVELDLSIDNEAGVALLMEARRLIDDGRPATAIEVPLQRLIATLERDVPAGRRVYCARTMQESALYSGQAQSGESVSILPWFWAEAFHLRAYALIELGRTDEAQAMVEKAVELSPSNAVYLSELGHIQQLAERSASALALFTRAEAAARAASPEKLRNVELTRALRGQGYALVEMGRFEEAELRYRSSLEVDPADGKSLDALHYVQSLRQHLDAGWNAPRRAQ